MEPKITDRHKQVVPEGGHGGGGGCGTPRWFTATPKQTRSFKTRRAAFRQAKRDAGVPTSQTHKKYVKNVKADKLDSKMSATEYEFRGKNLGSVQEHPNGYTFKDGGAYNKPHFNNHSANKNAPSTGMHYEYPATD